MARTVQVSSRAFLFDENGVHNGIRFTFGTGSVYEVRFAEIDAKVLAHATANGLGEAFRDTGAGKSATEAEAAFLKRLEVIKGGEYSARGGSRLDWVGDILEAINRMLAIGGKTLGAADTEKLRAELTEVEKGGTEAFIRWLRVNPTRNAIRRMVDLIRKERAAERAKAATSDISLGDII